jgi:hypothetical protein
MVSAPFPTQMDGLDKDDDFFFSDFFDFFGGPGRVRGT